MINCFIPSGFDYSQNDHVITNDCSTSNYDENKLVLYPHYTRGEQCQGKFNKNEPTAAHNCIENCERSISFPEGVYSYTTIFHSDIQTPTPTPIVHFSRSSDFSNSLMFIESRKFSNSEAFLQTEKFSKSLEFSETQTKKFSKSRRFSNSYFFSSSLQFSNFTVSNSFVNTGKFIGVNDDKKLGTAEIVGIIVGAVDAAAVIVGIIIFIVKWRKNRINYSNSEEMIETNDSSITVDNNLDYVMNEDDPFADDFKS